MRQARRTKQAGQRIGPSCWLQGPNVQLTTLCETEGTERTRLVLFLPVLVVLRVVARTGGRPFATAAAFLLLALESTLCALQLDVRLVRRLRDMDNGEVRSRSGRNGLGREVRGARECAEDVGDATERGRRKAQQHVRSRRGAPGRTECRRTRARDRPWPCHASCRASCSAARPSCPPRTEQIH